MLTYISIDATINRLNEVLGTDWSTKDVQYNVTLGSSNNDRPTYAATVSLALEALGKTAVGVGADVSTDLDKSLKTALAEALKKAGHQFGIALYLWDEAEREAVEAAIEQREVINQDNRQDSAAPPSGKPLF